ncbi:HNH endonuclease [Clostridium estertheticum]|uniref:ABC-three component system protein n=1 Tax=Clostridium estertheticum TaxID=238834 RepID=UPI001C0C44C5|nr:ABC-three component system protein [Clostridium estertheticum]MBU3216863.1 HNH endonuclease [Clostridium estertheticum]WAG53949.1 HNH endonuclease [Clostridium estertheticum]
MEITKSNDPYLIQRIAITDNLDNAYLLEVDGICPLCGKYMLLGKGKRMNKKYQIAHIYPNSPTPNEVKQLEGLERLGSNCEDFENKIALCKDCHGYYDDHKTKEEYLDLLKIKKNLTSVSKAKIAASHQDLEQEIILVINALSHIDEESLQKMKLEYQALKISNKIEDTYIILKVKVENYVCIFFNFIKEIFQDLDQAGHIDFGLVASEIKTTFLKCEKEMSSKSEIFRSLVKWLESKAVGSSNEACEAVISYFVQSCEVFHEIAK